MIRFRDRLAALLPAVAALLLASCHSLPKHARLIPKDALLVVSVHTGELGKHIAWSALTGSPFLDELRKAGAGDKVPAMLRDIEQSGIDFNNTLYCYTKPDNRYATKMRAGAVLPVANAAEVSAYVRKYLPGKAVRSGAKGIHEVMPDSSMVIAWNDDVLMVMNSISRQIVHNEPARVDTVGGAPIASEPYAWNEYLPDEAATYAEIEAAFALPGDGSIAGNERFKKLETAGHDITLYLAADEMMDMATTSGLAGTSLALGNTLWNNSAITLGLDFNRGTLDGLMRYYPADSMKPVAERFSKGAVDAGMLDHLPAEHLNLALGAHLGPDVLHSMLDRLNLTGYANLALAEKGLSIDDVLGAFSGDIAFALNNFHTETKMQQMDLAMQELYGIKPYPVTEPKFDYLVGLGIGDKVRMNKLIAFVTTGTGMMEQVAPNTFAFPNITGGPVLVTGDRYVAFGSTAAGATAFLKGNGGTPNGARAAIKGHPLGLWADLASGFDGAGEMMQSPSDSAAYAIVRGVFTTFTLSGGEWKSGATEYKARLTFRNAEENSLVQLLHMAQQLSLINKREPNQPI